MPLVVLIIYGKHLIKVLFSTIYQFSVAQTLLLRPIIRRPGLAFAV
jgi:hypothetical protein